MKKVLHILIVDDHQLFRTALIALFGTFTMATKMFEASNGKEALSCLAKDPIELVFLDIEMPEMNGIETLTQIRQTGNQVKVMVLTQHSDIALIIHLLHKGATGFLLKTCEAAELRQGVQTVMEKGHYYNNLVLKAIEQHTATPILSNLNFTGREFQVLELLKEGKSNKEIAKGLGLTQATVESYRKNLLKKTKSKNSIDLISLAYRTGLLK